ncbi:MAG TPA: GTPase [Tepidisphaeraceae bacterium]|nr:GTPase [Tepidisphaeraceae bacterium]
MDAGDTIVAMASAAQEGAARVVVRASGSGALRIAREMSDVGEVAGGSAVVAKVWPGVWRWVYAFVGPRSYTGEDSVELHVPGGHVGRMIVEEIVRRGLARPAEAGEFTARAYLNGRLDLTQAEGVAATISAAGERQARAARQLLSGELARRLSPVMEDLAALLALVEVGIDFSDEDVTFVAGEEVAERSGEAAGALDKLLAESVRFERLSAEPRIVLVGRPNAGKSTLVNALAGQARAVVSDVAGTTRDALSARVRLMRGAVVVVDVAGIAEGEEGVRGSGDEGSGGVTGVLTSVRHEGAPDGEEGLDAIERQMRERALREVAEADLVVLVRAVDDARAPVDLPRAPDLVITSKWDLDGNASGLALTVSALTGAGMDDLRTRLDEMAFGADVGGVLALNARHVAAVEAARAALGRVAESAALGPEVVALGLREALDALGDVLGRMSADDLLGRVFSQFCIGK